MTTLADLVSSMNGKPSTNQWDIVCSYTVSQLNQFLQIQYDAGKLAKEVSFSTDRQDPLMGTDFTISYDIQFASPQLGFISGRSGFTTLTMLIKDGSSYSVTPKGATTPTRTVSIPGGKYSVKAVVPLAAIKGDTGEIKEQGKIIEFSDGKSHDNHVIIHFKNEKGTSYEIVPEPDLQDKDTLVTYFLPVLKQYFQTEINEIDYALSTVNNSQPPSGLSVFTPKSFAFASMGDGDSGVLSLYIQTSESSNSPGNASPSFQPGDSQVFPVPESYTASIILSYDLITKAFLKPQLESSGFTVSYDTVSEGISAHLTKTASIVVDTKDGKHTDAGVQEEWEYEGLNIPLDEKHPLVLSINHSSDNDLVVSWSAETVSTWEYTRHFPERDVGTSGSVQLTISLRKSSKFIVNNNNLTIADLSIAQSDFAIDIQEREERWDQYDKVGPTYYRTQMKLTIPNISIALHGFDFFLDTNLLAPGQPMIQVDATEGVSTPHDFLIVGQVIQKTQP